MPTDSLDVEDSSECPPACALDGFACTNNALRRASRRLGQLYDDALAPTGLKATQVGLLAQISTFVSTDQQGPTLQELAARLAILISALTHAMKPLVRDGIVELRPSTLDKRTKHCVITPKGEALFKQAVVYWAQANSRVDEVLGHDSAKQLRAMADHVASSEFLDDYHGRV
ncbi:MarR family winged helix-turn-helix transcriptional regulator [Pseudomonas sp. SDO528_S397]